MTARVPCQAPSKRCLARAWTVSGSLASRVGNVTRALGVAWEAICVLMDRQTEFVGELVRAVVDDFVVKRLVCSVRASALPPVVAGRPIR